MGGQGLGCCAVEDWSGGLRYREQGWGCVKVGSFVWGLVGRLFLRAEACVSEALVGDVAAWGALEGCGMGLGEGSQRRGVPGSPPDFSLSLQISDRAFPFPGGGPPRARPHGRLVSPPAHFPVSPSPPTSRH